MSKHIHAELMAQYAQDAMETDKPWLLWQNSDDGVSGWDDLDTHPMWVPTLLYRRKTRTIDINGREVPEPVRGRPAHKTKYFIPNIQFRCLYDYSYWDDDPIDNHRLKHGLIHLTQEAAVEHAMALLSFTAKSEVSDE